MTGPRFLLLSTAASLIAIGSPADAAVVLPSWHGEPTATSQVFLFNTGSTTPSADVSTNPYGLASATVVTGFFGNGWENPADLPISNPGFDGDGAWDIGAGTDGSITITVPVAPGPPDSGEIYRIDLQIYVVAFKDLALLPVASVSGMPPGDLSLQSSNVLSTRPPAGSWNELTWVGVLDGHGAGTITITLNPPTGAVSSIDRVEIFSRLQVIPEASSALLALCSGVLMAGRRRRTRAIH